MTRPTGTGSTGTWPPLPPTPFPPEPPHIPRTPWQPEPRPAAPGPVSASAQLITGAGDWLAERLLEQRVVALSGELDAEAVNRAVAELALLDATGDEPVRLRLSSIAVDLDGALTLVDALDLMGAPVHVTVLGLLAGPAVAVAAVADRRVAGAHTSFRLCEPRAPRGVPGREIEAWAVAHAGHLRRLQQRLAEACGRPEEEIAADMRADRLLTAAQARDAGLVDAVDAPRRASGGPIL
jgi:ATP-dependent Clp protease protease subunit